MTAVMAGAAWAAALETRAGTSTAIGAASTAIRTTTAAVASAVTPSASIGPLKARARISADAGRITRKILTLNGAGYARSAGLAGEKDGVVLEGGRFSEGFASGRFDESRFGVFLFGDVWPTDGGGVFGTFVRGVGFHLRAVGGAALFDLLGFLFGEFGFCGGLIFFRISLFGFLGFFIG